MKHDDVDDDTNRIPGAVIDAAIEVHQTLGPGLVESATRLALAHELRSRGFQVRAKVPVGRPALQRVA